MKTTSALAAAALLALAGVCGAQPAGITPEMIATALPEEGAPKAQPGPYPVTAGATAGATAAASQEGGKRRQATAADLEAAIDWAEHENARAAPPSPFPTADALKKLHGPVLLINGGERDFMMAQSRATYDAIAPPGGN